MNKIQEIKKIKINKLDGDFISGDKNIYYPQNQTLYDLSDHELFQERSFCKARVSELYLKRVIPFIWFILGSIATLYFMFVAILPNIFGNSTPHDWAILMLIMFVGSVLPTVWICWIRYNDDELLRDYKYNFKEATKILRKREKL